MLSNHLILCHPLLLLPPSFPASGSFQWVSSSYKWPKDWSFSFSISPSHEYSGLISWDWFDLLAVQGTLKSLIQHHNSKASIFRHLAFFMVQLSHLNLTTGKTTALTRIPSAPLTSFIVMHPKAHLTSYSRMSGSRWVTTLLWLPRSLRTFWYSSLYSYHLFLISKWFSCGSDGKASMCNGGDPCLIPGSERSPGERNGNPL